jgi:hypothetical protein
MPHEFELGFKDYRGIKLKKIELLEENGTCRLPNMKRKTCSGVSLNVTRDKRRPVPSNMNCS